MKKTVLIVDDEQGFVEALDDALTSQGYKVLKASTVEDALRLLDSTKIDLVTIDIMLPPGKSLESSVDSHRAGLFLCNKISKMYPRPHALCISVVTDHELIRNVQKLGIQFLKKGEVPLQTVLDKIATKLIGIVFS